MDIEHSVKHCPLPTEEKRWWEYTERRATNITYRKHMINLYNSNMKIAWGKRHIQPMSVMHLITPIDQSDRSKYRL